MDNKTTPFSGFRGEENTAPMDLSHNLWTESNPYTRAASCTSGQINSVQEGEPASGYPKFSRSPLKVVLSNVLPSKKFKSSNMSLGPEDAAETSVKDRIRCEDCQIWLTSLASLHEHQLGKKHKMIVSLKNYHKANDVLSAVTDHECDAKTSVPPSQNINASQSGLNSCASDPYIRPSSVQGLITGYFCHLCIAPLSNQLSVESHLKGRKHLSLLRSINLHPPETGKICVRKSESTNHGSVAGTSSCDSEPSPVAHVDDTQNDYVNNWVSSAAPPPSTASAPVLPLSELKSVLRRLCLTQIYSLLDVRPQSQRFTFMSDEQLLALIDAKCMESMNSRNVPENEEQTATTSPMDKHFVQSFLLLLWCQQLASL